MTGQAAPPPTTHAAPPPPVHVEQVIIVNARGEPPEKRPSQVARIGRVLGAVFGAGAVTTLAVAFIPIVFDTNTAGASPRESTPHCVQVLEDVQRDVENHPNQARVLIAADSSGRTFVTNVEFESCGRGGAIADTVTATLAAVDTSEGPGTSS